MRKENIDKLCEEADFSNRYIGLGARSRIYGWYNCARVWQSVRTVMRECEMLEWRFCSLEKGDNEILAKKIGLSKYSPVWFKFSEQAIEILDKEGSYPLIAENLNQITAVEHDDVWKKDLSTARGWSDRLKN